MTLNEKTPSNRVRSLPERAQEGGFSIATLRRRIKAGDGPIITYLSTRRLGIRDDHWMEWLNARAGKRSAA
jgi:hypothetical protein